MGVNEDLLKSIRKNIRKLMSAIKSEDDPSTLSGLRHSLSIARKQEKEAKKYV